MTLKGGMTAGVPLSQSTRSPRLYRHALILMQVVQATVAGVPQEDDYGQPIEAAPYEVPFLGYLVENSSTKIVQSNWAGLAVGSHLLKAPPGLPMGKDDMVRWNVIGDSRRYQVQGVRTAFGRLHHLLADLQLVEA